MKDLKQNKFLIAEQIFSLRIVRDFCCGQTPNPNYTTVFAFSAYFSSQNSELEIFSYEEPLTQNQKQ